MKNIIVVLFICSFFFFSLLPLSNSESIYYMAGLSNNVIQFLYGDDNYDPTKLERIIKFN